MRCQRNIVIVILISYLSYPLLRYLCRHPKSAELLQQVYITNHMGTELICMDSLIFTRIW